MEVKFYAFPKDNRSTQRPEDAAIPALATLDMQLKEDCSITSPILIIKKLANNMAPTSYTYAYIEKFHRYYFVNDWTWNMYGWQVTLTVDVLASFKAIIGASTQYVLRANTTNKSYWNENLIDPLYPTLTDVVTGGTTFPKMFENNINNGTYIMGIINSDTTAVGVVSYYALTAAQMGAFKNALMNPAWISTLGIEDMSNGLLQTLYNPFQYIASCKYFPVPSSAVAGTNVTEIKFGWWSFNVSAKKMSGNNMQSTNAFSWDIPKHPQSITRGNYLNNSPYTEFSVFVPPFGIIPVDPSYFVRDHGFISIQIELDYISGQGVIYIFNASKDSAGVLQNRSLIYTASNMVACDIEIAQMAVDFSSSQVAGVTNMVRAGARSIGAGDDFFSVVGNVINAATSFQDYMVPQLSCAGTNGSTVAYYALPSVSFRLQYVAPEDITHLGRPVYKNVQISNLSGYILCNNAEIRANATSAEKDQITSYMNTGFYYE